MFFDGLNIHKSNLTKAVLQKHNVFGILNIAYQSPLNPIEQVWCWKKRTYKKRLLAFLTKNEAKDLDLEALVTEIMDEPTPMNFRKTVREKLRGLKELCNANVNIDD